MAILNKHKQTKQTINLNGPGGNAFALIGMANNLGKQLGMDLKQRGDINTEMISGDYENLIKVFDKNFGHIVDLVK